MGGGVGGVGSGAEVVVDDDLADGATATVEGRDEMDVGGGGEALRTLLEVTGALGSTPRLADDFFFFFFFFFIDMTTVFAMMVDIFSDFFSRD